MRSRATLTYSAYGYSSRLPSALTLLGFNGESIDASTGYYPLGKGYRMYGPNLMRFLSPDELSPFAEGGLNTYMYCNGDPIGKIDPTGRIPIFIKPFNSLYKGIKNRLFGRIPKSQRPSPTPAAKPDTPASNQGSNVSSQQSVSPFIQQMARTERSQLHSSYLMDLHELKTTDLTTVPTEVFERRLGQFNARKKRIIWLTQEYGLEPLRLPNFSLSAQSLPSNLALAIRQA
ncbi:MAG TPA: RHS repeat-associated core domain-containing protein [Pseudomonas sp.]|nr:RHS repeat-associated core domain-containing protein [Pseudomonas sp.]